MPVVPDSRPCAATTSLVLHDEATAPPGDEMIVADIVPQTPAPPPAAPAKLELSRPLAAVLNSRLAVVAILLVAGPIGLPVLWFSGRFSKSAKIVTTLTFFAVTVVFPLAMTYYWCEVALRPLVDALAGK